MLYNRFVSTGGPDLFVICKSCGSEVSPYITECPYCGNRLRKRAPKLDREGRVAEKTPAPAARRRRCPGCAAARSPGSGRTRARTRRSCSSLLGLVGCLRVADRRWSASTRIGGRRQAGVGLVAAAHRSVHLQQHRLRVRRARRRSRCTAGCSSAATAPRRCSRCSWSAASAASPPPRRPMPVPFVLGGNGAALALLCAWAVPDLLALRAGEEIEGDLLGTAAIAAWWR